MRTGNKAKKLATLEIVITLFKVMHPLGPTTHASTSGSTSLLGWWGCLQHIMIQHTGGLGLHAQVYFRLNTLRLCKNLINAVQSRQFLPFEAFPASQRVTYKFYTGRLAIFDEAYVRVHSLIS